MESEDIEVCAGVRWMGGRKQVKMASVWVGGPITAATVGCRPRATVGCRPGGSRSKSGRAAACVRSESTRPDPSPAVLPPEWGVRARRVRMGSGLVLRCVQGSGAWEGGSERGWQVGG